MWPLLLGETNMLDDETIKALAEKGLYTASGGLRCDNLQHAFTQPGMPFYAIWKESEVPTDEEMNLIEQMLNYDAGKYPHEKFISRGHNTMILRKDADGTWKCRRCSWTIGPTWVSRGDGSLLAIAEEEGYKPITPT